MKSSTFALLAVVGTTVAQGVTSAIAPEASAPASCEGSVSGPFEIGVLTPTKKRDLEKRGACAGDGVLVATLENGVIQDAKNRTGYIASNYQFQFDDPPQAGAIYTAGFSSCSNGSLALGGSTVFYECQSGTFFNLYDRNWAAQCSPVEIEIVSCSTNGDSTDPDGEVVGTQVVTTTLVTVLSDGQPQVITTTVPEPICQITDGQLQVHTTPCASVTSDLSTTVTPVSQYSDGQIQVTPGGTASGEPAATPTPEGSASGSVVLPTETLPGATGSGTAVGSNSTVTTASLSASNSAGETASASASGSVATAAPASGVGRVEMGSLAALVVGVVAAVWGF